MSGTPIEIPHRHLTPDEVLAHDDLYSEAQTLGGDAEPRLVREGGISFGRPVVLPLSLDHFPAVVKRRPGIRHRTFALISFPFDLDQLEGARRYVEASYRVELNIPDSVAGSLWPTLITNAVEVERSRTFTVGADLSLGAIEGAPSFEFEGGRTFRYTELQPVLTSFGAGQSHFSWTFTARPGQSLYAGSRWVFAVLDMPAATPTVLGDFVGEVKVARRRLGEFETAKTRPCRKPFRLQLRDGDVHVPPLGET